MDELSYQDACQIYCDALFIYKGKLVKIREIIDDEPRKVRLFDLKSQRSSVVEFQPEMFKTPAKRIGYVNSHRNAAYVIRLPLRMFKGGICKNNIEIRFPGSARHNDAAYEMKDSVRKLESPALLAAYNNDYPTLEKAILLAKEWESSCAFDKQFSVSSEGYVHYKEKRVGIIELGQIIFSDEWQYLTTLLDGNHEKTTRAFRSTPL